jgi:arylamine N-acetyltransferase
MTVTPVTSDDAAAYLRRLGVEPGPPELDLLTAIHRAHVERVPYETTWIHLGETWDVDPGAALVRIARRGRGGYCFHLNGALGSLLRALGYDVTTHPARMHSAPGRPARPLGDHAALLAHGLPTDANPGGRWIVDAGLGDGLYEPLPLVAGAHHQPPFTFEVTVDDTGWWHVRHDERGSFLGMSVRAEPITDHALFAARHRVLSTSPDSGFVRCVTAQRRTADGAVIVRGLVRKALAPASTDERVVDERAAWFELLADEFGLRLAETSTSARDGLWAHAVRAHEALLAATPP